MGRPRSTPTNDESEDTGGELWDSPNQQVVRADQSHPSQEGTGGEAGQTDTAADGDEDEDEDEEG